MSTNVPIDRINSYWDYVKVEAHTAVVPLFSYQLLTFQDASNNLMIEEEKVEPDEELRQLFKEFIVEDIELAELGMDDYSRGLLIEDME